MKEARDIGIGLLGVGALVGGTYLGLKLTGLIPPLPREEVIAMPSTKEVFAQRWMSALATSKPLTSVATRVLVVAHGAYESGYGKAPAAKGNNLWNLSAGKYWAGPVILSGDTEYSPGQTGAKKIQQRFRVYASPEEAVIDYFKFLGSARYAAALQKLNAGDKSFVVDLGINTRDASGKVVLAWPEGKGGFYTLPIPEYVAHFNKVLAEVQQLLQVTI